MASKALIIAHENNFNKGILKNNAYYFSNATDVKNILKEIKKNNNLRLVENNYEAIVKEFNWEKINGEYLQLFEECYSKSNNRK